MVVRDPDIRMSGDRHFTRLDLVEIKMLTAKKLGRQKAEEYFSLLKRFFTHKLSKPEFDKLCIVIIGRDNLTLHNQFIRSIVKNACLSKTAPAKASKHDCSVNGKVANGYQRSCLKSLCRDMFPLSPRRWRTPSFHDRKFSDRRSPLGPHGKSYTATCELGPKVLEQQSATELHSLGSRPVEINSVEDGEEVDQATGSPGVHSRSPVTATLGIQTHAKETQKVLSVLPSYTVPMETCYGKGALPDTSSLRKRMEQKLEEEGLKEVSQDCVNLLNSSLNVYLKRLIKPCLEMAGSRVGNKANEVVRDKVVPSVNGSCPVKYVQNQTRCTTGSLLDYQAAMQLNPTLLGKDWPPKLEKVSLQEQLEGGSGND